jgi:hypothetical protein
MAGQAKTSEGNEWGIRDFYGLGPGTVAAFEICNDTYKRSVDVFLTYPLLYFYLYIL